MEDEKDLRRGAKHVISKTADCWIERGWQSVREEKRDAGSRASANSRSAAVRPGLIVMAFSTWCR
jgi:hypothetical protein